MLQYSKVVKSRDEWKNKAVQRAGDICEHRKAKKRYLETIVKLKEQIILMEQVSGGKKTVNPTSSRSSC
jgi:hypothetical protein